MQLFLRTGKSHRLQQTKVRCAPSAWEENPPFEIWYITVQYFLGDVGVLFWFLSWNITSFNLFIHSPLPSPQFIRLMGTGANFNAKTHLPATDLLGMYSWTLHILQFPPRLSSNTPSCSVLSWLLNFPCQIKQDMFSSSRTQSPKQQVDIQKLQRIKVN